MLTAAEKGTRFAPATVGSVGVHVLAALLIPALAWTATSTAPVETISFQRIRLIEIQTPAPRQPPRARAPERSVKPEVTLVDRHSEAVTPRAHRVLSVPQRQVPRAMAPTLAASVAVGTRTEHSGTDPAPAASAAPREVASTGHVGGYLPFGATEPDPVLDPAVLQALRTLGVHTTLLVVVGDDGRTKSVAFDPLPDAATQARISALLADASWDPAVCGGGIACQGNATIKL